MARWSMTAIVDANLIAALVLPLSSSDQAMQRVMAWKRAGLELLAPALMEYEVDAVLRGAVEARRLTTELAVEAVGEILALNVRCLAPTAHLHGRALHWAERLDHSKAHDAHYLALAEQEGLELGTADTRWADAAQRAGASWVHWIGEESSALLRVAPPSRFHGAIEHLGG
jgi:predicted nucleic acid-binding protein